MLEDEQNNRYLNKIFEVLVLLKGAGFHNFIFSADVITLPLNSGVFGT